DLHPDADGAVHPDEHAEVQLVLLLRARGGPRWKTPAYPARQGARRLLLDQRPGVRARQRTRLRALGGAGRRRLGLSARPALLLARRAAQWPPERIPRVRGQARDAAWPSQQSPARGVARRGPAGGLRG